jgi:putative IMPACT (imprinted ancient) family translation regulator
MPILEVLRAKGLVDCAVVVTRYFGGILLGAGGLVRAYTQGCVIAVAAAGVVTMRPCAAYLLDLPYALLGRFENAIQDTPLAVFEKTFAASVTLQLRMPIEFEEEFLLMLSEITAGKADVLRTGEGWLPLSI